MKKIRAIVNENDRIVIDIINHTVIQYMLVERKTGKKKLLDEAIDFPFTAVMLKKIYAAEDENNHIVINTIKRQKIQYIFVEAPNGKETVLGEAIDFSLSVKKYFGTQGKTIKELYAFKAWHNQKLQTEVKRIWRAIDTQFRKKEEKVKEQPIVFAYESYNDERVA